MHELGPNRTRTGIRLREADYEYEHEYEGCLGCGRQPVLEENA